MINVKKWLMGKIFKNKDGKESEFSRLLELYFKAEDCALVGDDIINITLAADGGSPARDRRRGAVDARPRRGSVPTS